jgi:hypothetical protein
MKIRPVGVELFHADGQTGGQTEGRTDMTNLIVAFRNFVKAPNKIHCMGWLVPLGRGQTGYPRL